MNQSFLEELLSRQTKMGEAITLLTREHNYTARAIEEMLKLERLGNSRDQVTAASERFAERSMPSELPAGANGDSVSINRHIDPFHQTPSQPTDVIPVNPVEPAPAPDRMAHSREALLGAVDRLQSVARSAASLRQTGAAQHDGPTEVINDQRPVEPAPAPAPTSRRPELLEALVGRKSVFCRYFAPNSFAAGRGFLQPGHAGLKQYAQDVLAVPTVKLRTWPTGFYFNSKTGARQLMVNTAIGLVVVDDVDKVDSEPLLLPADPQFDGKAFRTEGMNDIVLEQVFVHVRTELERLTQEALGQ